MVLNIILEYAIRKSGIQTRGTIFYESVQLMAYADDIVTIGGFDTSMKEIFQLLEVANKEAGLVINEGKIKYMAAANTQNCNKLRAIEIGRHNFERVDSFCILVLW